MSKKIRNTVAKIPVVGKPLSGAMKAVSRGLGRARFEGSAAFWERQYEKGGTSGSGSYNRLAEFKAEVLNTFVQEHDIQRIIEFGCGDGNQLSLGRYPTYIGLDVTRSAIALCRRRFADDHNKSFFLYDTASFVDNASVFQADLTMSLDVLYHVVEQPIFEQYLQHLFAASTRYVIIYSTDFDEQGRAHVRHRRFTPWVESNIQGWRLETTIENRYPYVPGDPDTSPAEFHIYVKTSARDE